MVPGPSLQSLLKSTTESEAPRVVGRGLGSGIFWSSSRESVHGVEFSLLPLQEAAQGNTDVQNPPLAFAQGSKCLLAPPWTLVDWGTRGTNNLPLSFAFLNTDLLGSPGCGLSRMLESSKFLASCFVFFCVLRRACLLFSYCSISDFSRQPGNLAPQLTSLCFPTQNVLGVDWHPPHPAVTMDPGAGSDSSLTVNEQVSPGGEKWGC